MFHGCFLRVFFFFFGGGGLGPGDRGSLGCRDLVVFLTLKDMGFRDLEFC